MFDAQSFFASHSSGKSEKRRAQSKPDRLTNCNVCIKLKANRTAHFIRQFVNDAKLYRHGIPLPYISRNVVNNPLTLAS